MLNSKKKKIELIIFYLHLRKKGFQMEQQPFNSTNFDI